MEQKEKDLTFEQISDVVQVKLMKEFMEDRMDLENYSAISKGLKGLFNRLHIDQVNYEKSGITLGNQISSPTAPRAYKTGKERTGKFINAMA